VNDTHAGRVAVLLATYNGSPYVEEQILSLKRNTTAFTLHWLDDGSSDDTREVVRRTARTADLDLVEWHQPQHLGVPASFFRLLEVVDADVYLFCDQDDIWQPGKIDTTVSNLIPDIERPVLCSSDFLEFNDNEPGTLYPLSSIVGKRRLAKASRKPPVFLMCMHALASAQTQGFTRALRDIFLRHKGIAGEYALLHDCWMYDIAIASGTARTFSDAPTVLRRVHSHNASNALIQEGRNWILTEWRSAQRLRHLMARHAKGFIMAAGTLPPGQARDRLVELAQLIASVERRQSFRGIAHFARGGAMPWWSRYGAMWFSLACLFSEAGCAASGTAADSAGVK
jgi:glycosyltransferase involved in cell wall biosynthesis